MNLLVKCDNTLSCSLTLSIWICWWSATTLFPVALPWVYGSVAAAYPPPPSCPDCDTPQPASPVHVAGLHAVQTRPSNSANIMYSCHFHICNILESASPIHIEMLHAVRTWPSNSANIMYSSSIQCPQNTMDPGCLHVSLYGYNSSHPASKIHVKSLKCCSTSPFKLCKHNVLITNTICAQYTMYPGCRHLVLFSHDTPYIHKWWTWASILPHVLVTISYTKHTVFYIWMQRGCIE